jgi:hypothetical protein
MRVRSSRGDPPLPASVGRPSPSFRGPCATSCHGGDELAVGSLRLLALPLHAQRSKGRELAHALSDERAIARFGHFAVEQLDVCVANERTVFVDMRSAPASSARMHHGPR